MAQAAAKQPSIPDALAKIIREALAETVVPTATDANLKNEGKKHKTKMEPKVATLPEEVINATEQLAAAILRVEPIAAYQQAKARLDADSEARELLERLSKLQADLRTRQARNGITQADMDQLRALQHQVQTNQTIMDYARTQKDAVAYLPAVNIEISQLLGLDFAALAGPASC